MDYADRLDFDPQLARRDRALIDLDFCRRDFRFGKLRSSQLLAVPGMSHTGGAGFLTSRQEGRLTPAFAANEPGLTDRGVALWEARTNRCIQSNDFSTVDWGRFGFTYAANDTTGPDGVAGAMSLTINTSGAFQYQGFTTTAGQLRTFSIFLKKKTADWANVSLYDPSVNGEAGFFVNLNTGAIGSVRQVNGWTIVRKRVEDWGNGWYRCVLTAASTTAAIRLWFIPTNADNTTGGAVGLSFYASHVMFEDADDASPPVVTAGTTRTRTRTALTLSLARLPLGRELDVWVEYEPAHVNGAEQYLVRVRNTATPTGDANTLTLRRYAAGGAAYIAEGNDVATLANIALPGLIATNQVHRMAASYANGQAGSAAHDGVSLGEAAQLSATGVIEGLNSINFGDIQSGNGTLNGYLRRVIIGPRRQGLGSEIARTRL